MENFSAQLISSRREPDNMLYVFYKPFNKEIYDDTGHGQTIPLIGTIQETTDAYEKTAAYEMFSHVISVNYPDQYQLDPKYNF